MSNWNSSPAGIAYNKAWIAKNPDKVAAKRERRYALVRDRRLLARDAGIAELVANGCVPIVGFPYYLVSAHGEIYSTLSRRLMRVTPGVKPGGYEFVGLRPSPGKTIYKMVHRIVAEAFIANPDNLPVVNHMDGNKRNNTVANLEWVTHLGNIQHAIATGLMRRRQRKLDQSEILAVRVAEGTYRTIGERFGVSAQTVCNIKRGFNGYHTLDVPAVVRERGQPTCKPGILVESEAR